MIKTKRLAAILLGMGLLCALASWPQAGSTTGSVVRWLPNSTP